MASCPTIVHEFAISISWVLLSSPSEAARRVGRFFSLERTVTIAVVAIVCWQLFVPPILGLADNGDFARLTVFFDLTHAPTDRADRYFGFLTRHYVVDAAEARRYSPPGFISSELLFIAGPVAINRLLGKTSFDLLELGAVMLSFSRLLPSFCCSLPKPFAGPVRTSAIIIGAIAFTDIAYIAYFNSFYGESATFLLFMSVAACAYGAMSSGPRRIVWLVAYFAAVTAFLLAKYQNLSYCRFFFLWRVAGEAWGEVRYFRSYLVFFSNRLLRRIPVLYLIAGRDQRCCALQFGIQRRPGGLANSRRRSIRVRSGSRIRQIRRIHSIRGPAHFVSMTNSCGSSESRSPLAEFSGSIWKDLGGYSTPSIERSHARFNFGPPWGITRNPPAILP